MELLIGEYRNTLDEKGRILFPTKLRKILNVEVLIVTQAVDHCLWLFTQDEWKNLSNKLLESASPFDSQALLVLRRFVAPAQEVAFDSMGRLSIPQTLREYANLSKDCVVLGVNKYIELWDSASYRAYLDDSESLFRQATEKLSAIRF